MAFSANSGSGPKSDINITPLVDVVLVLLIIFMVMTPSLIKEMPVEVPEKADVQLATPTTSDQLVVKISREGTITVKGEPVLQPALIDYMRERLAVRADKLVFFDIDDGANYGDAMHVMDLCRGAGAKVLGLKTK
jgi:biopolymer transport protein ExbD